MSIRWKLLALAGVLGLTLLTLAAGARIASSSVGHSQEQITRITAALRNHTLSDMMHDTLRADVYVALFDGSHGGNDRAAILKDVEDHVARFKSLLAANAAIDLPASVRGQLMKVEAPLAHYAAGAREIAALAYDDIGTAVVKLAEFDRAFLALESAMERTGDELQDAAEVLSARADQVRSYIDMGVVAAMIVVAVLLPAMFWTVIWGTLAPFARIERAMVAFAAGDHTVAVPTERRDEAGSMARSLVAYRTALQEAEVRARTMQAEAVSSERKLITDTFGIAIERLAKNDLSHRILVALPGEYEQLRTKLNDALELLSASMMQVRGGCRDIENSTSEINTSVGYLSLRTEAQAASLEETSSAIGNIAETLSETAKISKGARDLVVSAVGEAERSAVVVTRATDAMNAIKAASIEMDTVITVIDEIAFQTNLLALNAGVEAARAGAAGRGFAVVASEVRALALRSADAAKEIKSLIARSKEQVGQGVGLVGQAGSALIAIKQSVNRINHAVSQIAERMEEQSASIEQVTQAVAAMDETTQRNAAMAEQTSAATRRLAAEAQTMRDIVGRFQVEEGRDDYWSLARTMRLAA